VQGYDGLPCAQCASLAGKEDLEAIGLQKAGSLSSATVGLSVMLF